MSAAHAFLQRLGERFSDEPTWVTARRQAGAARFEALGFPTKRDEAWKYTDVRRIAEGEFALTDDAELSASRFEALSMPLPHKQCP